MPSLFTELRRRNVFKVGAAYAIVAWLLVQVVDVVLPALQMPDWTISFVTVLLIIGFPITLIMAWAFEMTPEGIKADADVPRDSITPATGRKLDFAIIGALVLALGFVVYNYVLEDGELAAGVLPNSVAVLLCANLSPDPDDAYIAASIHDEILNQLFKIRALNVIARTSVLQYADAPPPISQIAEELNVGAVMECTVRYAGDAILVTAQLIDPETNVHLWSDTYPGDMSDLSTIFAMQADIAMNIANAVGAEFSFAEQERIEGVATDSSEAYEFFLKATQVPGGNDALRLALLDQAIDADPDFAYARTARAFIRTTQLLTNIGTEDNYLVRRAELETLALEDIEKALASDPTLGGAHAVLARIHQYNWRATDALEAFEQAIQLSPNNMDILNLYISLLSDVDQHDEAIRQARRAVELDPNNSRSYNRLGRALLPLGEDEAAITAHRKALNLNPNNVSSQYRLSIGMMLVGDEAEAADQTRLAEALAYNRLPGIITNVAYSYSRLGLQEDATRVLNRLEEQVEGRRMPATAWVQVNLARGDENQAFEWLRRAAENKEPYEGYNLVHYLRRNDFRDPILDQPRFVELREQLGFTDL